MVSLNFRKTFLLFWNKFRCIVVNKTEKFFVKKGANHTISIYGKSMTIYFFDGDDKNFSKYFRKFLSVFFSTAKRFSYSNKHF